MNESCNTEFVKSTGSLWVFLHVYYCPCIVIKINGTLGITFLHPAGCPKETHSFLKLKKLGLVIGAHNL